MSNGTESAIKTKINNRLMSVDDVAEALQCSPRTVWRMADEGLMPKPLKLRGMRRWPLSGIDKWIADGCPASPTE